MASIKSSEYTWAHDESDDVPLIIGTNGSKTSIAKRKWKKFILYAMIIILSTSLIAALIFYTSNTPKWDVIKEKTALDITVENSCGSPFTCDYYLNTPCTSTCWHNTWDVRDRECENMGSFNCRWSFEAPMALIQGRCYCCDLKCDK